jgi:hypothetical protein
MQGREPVRNVTSMTLEENDTLVRPAECRTWLMVMVSSLRGRVSDPDESGLQSAR